MFVQGFGEVLTDILTVNPAIGSLPSASSILDTSNYTFQAVAFGKDAGGFTQHSHAVSSTQYVNDVVASGASSFDSGILKFIDTYNSVPNDPSPLDIRLERGSTLSTNLAEFQVASALPDSGQYVNAIIDPQLSAIWNKVGAFAPSGGAHYRFHDKDKTLIFSGSVSSPFNTSALMDKNGFLTVSPSSVSDLNGEGFTDSSAFGFGALVVSSASFGSPESAQLQVSVLLKGGDALTLVSFGSVKHIGLYCLDLKEMLSSGLMPPYNHDALNSNRKYKLVAKSTVLGNPLFHRDLASNSGLASWLDPQSTIISLKLDFK